MSSNPFHADLLVAARIDALDREVGTSVRQRIGAALSRTWGDLDNNLGGVLVSAEVAAIRTQFGLSIEELLLLARQHAEGYARPPISKFYVGCVGLEAETGNIIFGGNLEFPGAHIGNTVHGEGFVFSRAFSRGTSVAMIALGEAHPCAHCRQYLSEFAATSKLVLIDPLGHRLTMGELYPWPFDPAYLGEKGIVAGEVRHPGLELAAGAATPAVAEKLTALGRRSYTPYGKAPAAIALTLSNGLVIGGSAIESVSFNPTISPLQAAMIDLFAHGFSASDIVAASIGVAPGAAVGYAAHAADLLRAVAPGVVLETLAWQDGTWA